ncbi:glycosyltransferase [uncultured Cyclobacterium sp.]|uniref:glycosyltransferase n=1 Tax=uncultured Cyclobacterium sp. TaxID=453820 RepID=UPI0030ED5367|tara:strand:+ start:51577 stop:52692 length:1116 start_codon:yes stop_codon:yes gene_type:complete
MPKKVPLIIASVLKPLDDSRMLYKLGFSIRETNKYDLNIIGFSTKKTPKVKNIRLIEIFSGPRTHPARLLVPFKFLKQLFKIKPAIVIVTTFELLPVATIGKWLLSYRLIYDVQENYVKNLVYNQTLPPLGRILGISMVKISEKFSQHAIDHYLFAEQCYVSEMPAINKHTVIENKAAIPALFKPSFPLLNPGAPHFIISGTITPVYGVIPAINWFLQLNKYLKKSKLTIVGHCPMKDFAEELAQNYGAIKGIKLELSQNPLPASFIQEKIELADVLLLPYLQLPSIKDKIPTKLYEGIASQKVILMADNPLWKTIVDKYPAGMCIDFSAKENALNVWKTLLNLDFYQFPPDASIDWQVESKKLQHLIQNI